MRYILVLGTYQIGCDRIRKTLETDCRISQIGGITAHEESIEISLEYTFNPDSARRMKYCLCDLVITKSMKFENA